MRVKRVRQHTRLYRRPLTDLQKADIERDGQRIAEAYEAPGWDEVFKDFDELGRLKPKVEETKS